MQADQPLHSAIWVFVQVDQSLLGTVWIFVQDDQGDCFAQAD